MYPTNIFLSHSGHHQNIYILIAENTSQSMPAVSPLILRSLAREEKESALRRVGIGN